MKFFAINHLLTIIILIAVFHMATVLAASQDSLLVMTPHRWLESFEQTILIDKLELKSGVISNRKLKVNVVKTDDSSFNFDQTENVLDSSSQLQLVKLKLPDNFPSGFYNLTINVTDSVGDYFFSNYSKDIEFVRDIDGFYLITDKSVYRAGELIRFRVVGLNALLSPIDHDKTVSISILDPNSNLIEKYTNLTFKSGLIDDMSFQLSSKAILGTWKIKLQINNAERVRSFYVKEYVLPRFDFTLEAPTDIVKSSSLNFEGVLDAKYNYGKYVEGDVTLTILNKNIYIESSKNNHNVLVSRAFKLPNQRFKFSLPLKLNIDQYYYTLALNVTVKDGLTGELSSKEFTLNVHDNEYKVSLDRYEFETGKTNEFKISLKDLNDKPYALKEMSLNVIKYVNFEYPGKFETFGLKSDLNGYLNLAYYVPENVTSLNIELSLANGNQANQQKTYLYLYKKYQANFMPSNDLISIDLIENNIEKKSSININSNVDFRVRLNKKQNDSSQCYKAKFLTIARSVIGEFGEFELCDEKILNVKVDRFNAPYLNFIAYLFDEKMNLHVKNLDISAANFYSNQINIEFESKQAEPGQNVTLNIKSTPNSIVGLCVYDQSLDLIEPPNDLKHDEIFSLIDKQKLTPYYKSTDYGNVHQPFELAPAVAEPVNMAIAKIPNFQNDQIMVNKPGAGIYQYYETNSAEMKLNQLGLITLHDLNSLRPVLKNGTNPIIMMNDVAAFRPEQAAAVDDINFKTPSSSSSINEKVRSNFRESWIWKTININENGQYNLTSIIPDTITTWVATGFSLSEQYGLAIANKTNITGFQNFFVSMILPKYLTRGETLTLQVVVYNYLNFDLENVTVGLLKTNDFKNVILTNKGRLNTLNDITNDLETQIPLIKSQTGQQVTFLLTPIKIGNLQLSVRARSSNSVYNDMERKSLLVKAEGIQDNNNIPLLIDLRTNKKYETSFDIVLPSNIVPDSQYCCVQVIGDLLGPAFNNLDNLINKPYGCGEQNMITLTPNIYALKYLLSTNKNEKKLPNTLLDTMIRNSKSNIQFGYQNQLNYMREDGSFSAFGKSDKSGSTWLTAFVIKSFSEAKEFVTIDDSILKKSIKWLTSQQNQKDGSFNEPGQVIHSDMQGGVNSRVTVTAYVVIALIQSNITNDPLVESSIKNGLKFLEKNIDTNNNGVYSLGLITYALTIGNSSLSEQAFQKFDSFANRKISDQIYWSSSNNDSSNLQSPIYKNEVASSDVEITSYALLTYLHKKNKLANALFIVKWLISKSNSLGSYSSTQNTILALESLAQFGIELMLNNNTSPLNANIQVTLNSNNKITKVFEINEENSLLLQTWELNDCNRTRVFLNATGNGIVSFKTIINYNLPQSVENQPQISISQSIVTKGFKNKNIIPLRTCARLMPGVKQKNSQPGMFIVESELFAGFETNLDKNKIKNNLKLVELSKTNDKVIFYFDYLNETLTCIDWQMIRIYPVSNLRPITVSAYDYYNPLVQRKILVTSPADYSMANICKINPSLVQCK